MFLELVFYYSFKQIHSCAYFSRELLNTPNVKFSMHSLVRFTNKYSSVINFGLLERVARDPDDHMVINCYESGEVEKG